MAQLKSLLGVDNVIAVNRDGSIVAQVQDMPVDFSYNRYGQLRSVFDSDEPSAAVEVSFADTSITMRYYAARIDGSTMAFIEQNPVELDDLIATTGSLASVLSGVSVGHSVYTCSRFRRKTIWRSIIPLRA